MEVSRGSYHTGKATEIAYAHSSDEFELIRQGCGGMSQRSKSKEFV